MKISLNWLRDWVDTGSDVPALAHALTMAGLEIEGIAAAGPSLPGVVVGEVKSVTKHPDAEKLNVCVVSTGKEEFQIVCGAPNVRVGMKAPLATIGAKLPNGTEIKQAKLRGVESFGMLCSARELGINEEASGLYDLPADLKPGQALVSALGLDDTIFEVNLTPNRGDAMSVQGVAREVAAARGKPLHAPVIEPVAATITDTFPVRIETGGISAADAASLQAGQTSAGVASVSTDGGRASLQGQGSAVPVAADAPIGCYKFVSRVVRGIHPNTPSPFWMQERLRRVGLRPINAVVDITNYVMLELGAPMHAYNLGKLSGGITVRFAKTGEKLKLLDGRDIVLTPDVLVIADERSILGMAGVMGGEDSGISNDTVEVLFECAFFDPNDVAGRGRRYGLITDASQRFERGVDPELQERAVERATQLLLDSAGGNAGPLVVTRAARNYPAPPPIRLRHKRVEHVLGAKIDATIVQSLLERLGMKVIGSAGEWQVTPPTWRFDVRIEADLIEEVARLHGFENIPEAAEIGTHEPSPWTETHVRNERASDLLVDRGYQEAINYAFTDQAYQAALCPEPAVALSNAISAELAVMRVSLWPGLLQALGSNQRRQQPRVRLFEVGRRYSAEGETEVIAGVATGAALPEQWGADPRKIDFFDVKGDVEALIGLTGASDEFGFITELHPALHPGQSARIYRGNRPVGWLGAIHPEHSRRLDLTYPVFVFELETAAGLAAIVPEFEEISRYPAIRRDIASIVDEGLPVEAVLAVVQRSAGSLLKRLTVLSVYQGQQLQKGKKSIALGLQLQDTSRTLTDNEADALVAQVVEQLGRQLNATLRDQ